MRTTVTLDPDVEKYLRDACYRSQKSFKQVLNDALRRALKPDGEKPVLKSPRPMGRVVGFDPRRLQEVADEMEVDSYLDIERRRGKSTPSKS